MSKQFRSLWAVAAIVFAVPHVVRAQQYLAPTNFGSVNIGSSSTQTVTFTGMPAAASFAIYTGTDFSIAPANCSAGTCSIVATFQPQYPGLRQGAITASSQSGLVGVAFLYGIGTGPQINISPGLISTVVNRATFALSAATPDGMAVAPGFVIVSDGGGNVVYSVQTSNGTVTAYAGNGTAGYSGDGGAATSAKLQRPSALALDALGDLFIADSGNNVVREVNAFSNIITTVAGTGAAGNAGDGGNANAAQLNDPNGIAVDAQGNLYISDMGNNRIRKVTAINGQITSASQIANFAGSSAGTAGSSGDGGAATSAQLNQPVGIGLDSSGNLFIADSVNEVIRKVSGGTISRVAGTTGSAGFSGDGAVATSAQLNEPWGVAVDAAGNIYIADRLNLVVRKVTGDSNHTISTIAGTHGVSGYAGDGGIATSATLAGALSAVVDGPGNVFILDGPNAAVREVAASGAPLTFPATLNGNTSAAMTLTVSNTGDANLTFTGLAFTGFFSQTGSTGQCSSSTVLAQGASCTIAIQFAPTGTVTPGTVSITDNSLNQSGVQSALSLYEASGLRFIQMTPCRVIDTRVSDGYSGSALTAGVPRDYIIPNTPNCTVPNTALAFSFNVAVVPHGPLSYLTIWPRGVAQPGVASLNSYDGRVKSAAAIIPSDSSGGISVFATGNTDLVMDIDGYFVPSTASNYSSGLAFYPLTPCRVADTRVGTGALGGPALGTGSTRSFPVLSSSCAANIPANVAAYSFNLAAVPSGPLGYLTAWPTGQAEPVSAVLNAPTGTVTSNAAIVPAGTSGQVSVFASNATDLVIDINGYFAPVGANGLSLYTVTPCRALDTRVTSGVFSGVLTAPVEGVTCGTGNIPASAQAYVVNATVVPSGALSYITTWAQGLAQPLAATLNADDGAVTSNLSLIPTINGSIAVFASNPTNIILDVFGYFAP